MKLLKLAHSFKQKKKSRMEVNSEIIDLAEAYIYGNITLAQVSYALKKEAPYSILINALRHKYTYSNSLLSPKTRK